MENGRINERNTGHSKADGGAKIRRASKKITDEEKSLSKEIILKVLYAMEYDKLLSDRGRLHPDAIYTDGGRITISMTRYQMDKLHNLIEKL